ncbi:hypothetical protein SAMN05444285_107122 [Draconibacterium orientale]|uniref:HEAT repeat-containing protein n=1 Tax=Draconibacterium orientale TaxID=1168034 RepID=X5E5I1_9BACT|nr:hypothetical protein [Draconibacterium orientale]AHW61876.1 hypothetical protein FH5T_10130 [Draconibacterium orientale]SET19024.1 hypothetical protein SAMN05444285_107122 [Draconibacterium orientale]
MTEQELFEHLNAWENIEVVAASILNDPEQFHTLVQLALNDTRQKSWRAAYLVDKIHDEKPELLQPYLRALIGQLETEMNASKRRHWLKLISMNALPKEHIGFLFDYCIEAFTSGSEAVAVRVHAMQILFNISELEPDLKPEVLQIIEQEMEFHPTAGIRSRGKKLATKLFKQIQRNSG